MYETFDHTADIGLHIEAEDLNGLFAEAARGLLSLFVDNPEAVRPLQEEHFRIEGTETDYLLFDWLNELLYRFETEGLLFSEFSIEVSEAGLNAVARGEPADPQRHRLAHEVKAITYHQFEVTQTPTGWQTRVIVDI